jgi:phosphate-selective porin OprO/OprP
MSEGAVSSIVTSPKQSTLKTNTFHHCIIAVVLCLTMGSTAMSQETDLFKQFDDTAIVSHEQHPADATPITAKKWNQWKFKGFTMNLGLAFLLDHNILNQDAENIQQIGKVEPATEFRGERIVLSGTLDFFKLPWKYMFSANFNGLDAPPDKKNFDFIDWYVEIPLGKKAGWLTVGKQREGVGLEYIFPGTLSPFMERGTGTPMFVRQRNVGIRYGNSILNQRMTVTLGLFNNWMVTGKSFSANGSQITARVSGLPHYESDRELIHMAIAYRGTGATDGKLSYKAKGEVNTAPYMINTGSFDAEGAGTMMIELLGVKGPFSAFVSHMHNQNRAKAVGDPVFNAFQVGGSWFITGENRRYNKLVGNPGKIIPKRNFNFRKGTGPGAWELASRFTSTDGTDAGIQGGVYRRFTMALSWFVNTHFRYEINYGRGRLDKAGVVGHTDIWQFRAQFEL